MAHEFPLSKRRQLQQEKPCVTRALGILDTVDAYKRPFESLFDTAIRMLLEEALQRTKTQKQAASLLRIHPRVLVYHKHRWPEIYPTALRERS